MAKKRGILIHPEEVGNYRADILVESDLNLVAIHPKGGVKAAETLNDMLEFVKTDTFLEFAEKVRNKGIEFSCKTDGEEDGGIASAAFSMARLAGGGV